MGLRGAYDERGRQTEHLGKKNILRISPLCSRHNLPQEEDQVGLDLHVCAVPILQQQQ